MAQTRACSDGSARARRMVRQRGRVLKNERFSGVLKPPWRFSPATRKRYIIHKKRRVFFKPGISTGERGRDHSATCIILPLPPENPTCYSLCSKTDFPEVVAMQGLSRRQRQIVMLMVMGKRPKRDCPHVIHSTRNGLQASGNNQKAV